MTAPANTAEPAQHPDPGPDQASAAVPSPRFTRLLGVVRALIVFGQALADKLNGNPSPKTVFPEAGRFGTCNIALILARIARGLQLATALEAKLALRADRPEPERPLRAPSPRTPRGPRAKTPEPTDADSASPTLPTAEEIAEKLRRHPVHTVLIEICSDLGLAPADPLWWEVSRVIMEYGGAIAALDKDFSKRSALTKLIPPNVRFVWPDPPQPWQWPPPSAVATATGPP